MGWDDHLCFLDDGEYGWGQVDIRLYCLIGSCGVKKIWNVVLTRNSLSHCHTMCRLGEEFEIYDWERRLGDYHREVVPQRMMSGENLVEA